MSSLDSWSGINKDQINYIWPEVQDMVVKACQTSNGRLSVDEIYDATSSGDMQLWVAHRENVITACFVTRVVNYPAAKYAQLLIGTGTGRKRWQHYVRVLEGWAKSQGCDGIESIARIGWSRVFQRFGWKQTHVFLEKQFKE